MLDIRDKKSVNICMFMIMSAHFKKLLYQTGSTEDVILLGYPVDVHLWDILFISYNLIPFPKSNIDIFHCFGNLLKISK